LKLNHNNLTELPASIGFLKKLGKLTLNYNRLKSLPSQIADCKSIAILYVGKNYIETLPAEMGSMQNLIELDLSNSGTMLIIPETLCNLQNLEYLQVDRNTVVPYCFQGNRGQKFVLIVQ